MHPESRPYASSATGSSSSTSVLLGAFIIGIVAAPENTSMSVGLPVVIALLLIAAIAFIAKKIAAGTSRRGGTAASNGAVPGDRDA